MPDDELELKHLCDSHDRFYEHYQDGSWVTYDKNGEDNRWFDTLQEAIEFERGDRI